MFKFKKMFAFLFNFSDNNKTWPWKRDIEKPFQCDKCPGKAYTRRENLYRHKRVECQKKPQLECKHCHRKFYYRSTLVSHEKSHICVTSKTVLFHQTNVK